MTLVAGRYETGERIGGGGMADVFRAWDRTLGRDVALKIMRPAFAGDRLFVERFRREAEALASIEHPNIVRVFDYGETADGPFIAMELVPNGTLREHMRSRERLDPHAAAAIAATIAGALDAAHRRGVLHRDLKPDNVLLGEHGEPKIADFGIARLAEATTLTRTGELLGTPQYLAPEQITGTVVDERADVFALGVILYEMVTGAVPTGGTTPSEIVSRRLRTDPRPPAQLAPVPPALNAVILRALARDAARRFQRAADLATALRAINPPVKRSPAVRRAAAPPPFSAAIGLALAIVGGGLVLAGSLVPIAAPAATTAPTTAVLVRTTSPDPAAPTPGATPQPPASPPPTPVPTEPPAPAVESDPTRAILAFYEYVSGRDYASASALWSASMRAAYPPQTNIWGRFDSTRSIVTRSAAITSAGPGAAAVAVDLIETMRDGSVRHWVGTWYLVRTDAGWLLDRPGLRAA